MNRLRGLLAALLVAAAAVALAAPARVSAASQAGDPARPSAQQESPAGHDAAGQGHEREAEGHEAGGGWLSLIARIFNFAVLVGVLLYFLKAPLTTYLASRITKVREELVTAAATRETATRQLAEIEARVKALPAQLEALKTRGIEDTAAERVRIEQAAEADRQRLLEQTRREIEMRLRVARRELIEQAAELAIAVAGDRVKASITPDDQARLIDRYTSQLREVRQ